MFPVLFGKQFLQALNQSVFTLVCCGKDNVFIKVTEIDNYFCLIFSPQGEILEKNTGGKQSKRHVFQMRIRGERQAANVAETICNIVRTECAFRQNIMRISLKQKALFFSACTYHAFKGIAGKPFPVRFSRNFHCCRVCSGSSYGITLKANPCDCSHSMALGRAYSSLSSLFRESWNVIIEPLRAYFLTFRSTSRPFSLML